MPLSKEANERLWNALIKEALIEKCSMELQEIKAETEAHEFSSEFKKSIKKIMSSIGKKENIKQAAKVFKHIAVTTAAIMGIIFGALLTQPEVYAAVSGIIKSVFNTYDHYSYNGNSTDTLDKNKQLGYVPYGYEIKSIYYSNADVSMTYENNEKMSIMVDYGIAENFALYIDNERHTCIEFNQNNTTYFFYLAKCSNEDNVLMWYENDYYYVIYAQFPQDELVKIAENIK